MTRTLAAIRNPVLPSTIGGAGEGGAAFGKIIGGVVGGFFVFAFILGFLYLLTGGISWITSGGDKGKLEEARNKITNALIGIVVVGAAWAVTLLVSQFFGVDFPNLPIPSISE